MENNNRVAKIISSILIISGLLILMSIFFGLLPYDHGKSYPVLGVFSIISIILGFIIAIIIIEKKGRIVAVVSFLVVLIPITLAILN